MSKDNAPYGQCFACSKRLGANPALVTCEDDQTVFVGSECFKRIKAAGSEGWQPQLGPRLYLLEHKPKS